MSDKAALVRLIQDRPGILAVQVADAVDMETPAAEDMLLELIDEKLVQSHMITGPNGRATKAYTLSGVALPTQRDKAMEALKKGDSPKLTYGERAVLFIEANGGEASTEELHSALGLERNQFVSTFLANAVKAGQVNKNGQTWKIGAGPVAKVASTGNYGTIPGLPKKPTGPVAQFEPKQDGASPPAAKPGPAPVSKDSQPTSPPAASNGVDMDSAHFSNKEIAKQVSNALAKNDTIVLTKPAQDEAAAFTPETPVACSIMVWDSQDMPRDIDVKEENITFGVWSNGEFHIAHDGILLLKLSSKKLKEMHAYLDKARMLL